MTEEEWVASKNPSAMLASMFRSGIVSERKLRLFAVACCTMNSNLFNDPSERKGIIAAEKVADDAISETERELVQEGLYDLRDYRWDSSHGESELALCLPCEILDSHFGTTEATELIAVIRNLAWHQMWSRLRRSERLADRLVGQARLFRFLFSARSRARTRAEVEDRLFDEQARIVRDIFGNPYRPVTFDPHWHTSDVLGLARAIYDDRAFDRLPILADALMDAGCADEQVHGHCRGEGPHVRGCWVVDLVLGKE
jgi:hypothetical protein